MAKRIHESSDESEDVPLTHKSKIPDATPKKRSKPESTSSLSSPPKHTSNGKKKVKEDTDSSDEDAPLAARGAQKVKVESSPQVPSEAKKSSKSSKKRLRDDLKESKKKDRDLTKKSEQKQKKAKEEPKPELDAKTSAEVLAEEEAQEDAEEEDNKWWMQEAQGDGTVKWTTLEHNGVLFPPEYEPHGVKMKYDGQLVTLPPESEEIASFFGSMLNSDHTQNPTFQENFFKDFQAVLNRYPPKEGIAITDFDKCDFTAIFEHFDREREAKKAMSKEQKKAEKEKKEVMEEPYRYCYLDGRKEKVGNFRVEPPSLFRGRGKHPKTGRVKQRVRPEQITINIGKDAKVPEPPAGHSWGKIIHDDTVTWLAMWRENINGAFKYVFLAAGSSLKGQSDLKKFEKSRQLKEYIDRIRMDYRGELRDKAMAIRQRATAIYLIDVYALRAGNEKGEDEADTVGCCSLRCEHVSLTPPNKLIFDFLGKDSIRFYKEAEVEEQVFKNMRIFKKEPKEAGDLVFDRLTTGILNKHLGYYMPGLSAKVFRTYNASHTFEKELEKNTDPNSTLADKLLAYNRANREVAVLCNHQKSVSKNHAASMERLGDRIRALKYQRRMLRYSLFSADSSYRKKKPQLTEDESDVDEEWMVKHEADLLEKEKLKATKKFGKENTKLKEAGKDEMDDKELQSRLQVAEKDHMESVAERKSKAVSSKRAPEKIIETIEKLDARIEAQRVASVDREEGKETSLGTSKINYIDPRLTFAWCKRYEVPVEKIFNKSLREKFPWAATVDADWKF